MLGSEYNSLRVRNVALVVPAIAREGITKQVANQIIGLQQHGLNVNLIVLAKSQKEVLKEYGVAIENVPTLELRQADAFLSPRAFLGVIGIIKPITDFLTSQKVECVIAHAPYTHFVMRLVKLCNLNSGSRFNLVQYYHGLQYSEYPVNTWKRKVIHKLNSWLALKCDDRHVSVSEAVKQEIAENFFRHPNHVVLYNNLGLEAENFHPIEESDWTQVQQMLGRDKGKYKVLLPNRIDYNKGQLFFMEVLDRFMQFGQVSPDNIVVYMVGDGPDKNSVQKAADAMGLGYVVNLTGTLPNNAVVKLMGHVDLVVVPSFREGFSFAGLEALQAGALVLASDSGGLKEVVRDGETGFLFRTGDGLDCQEKLNFLYTNRAKVLINTEVVKQDLKDRFSQEAYMQQLLQFIQAS